MNLFNSKIIIILLLIATLSVIDIFDDQILWLLDLKGNGPVEEIIDTASSSLIVMLIICALIIVNNIFYQLDKQEKQYRNLIELSPEAILIHRKGKILYTNGSGAKLLGISNSDEAINYNLMKFIHPDSIDHLRSLEKRIKSNEEVVLKHRFKVKRLDGTIFDVEFTSAKIEYGGQPAREVIVRDITIEKKREDEMKQLVYQDALTGLPNRRAFVDKMNQTLSEVKRDNAVLAVMFIDLDGFKQVNDTLGHEAGDLLLKQVSNRFKDCINKKDMVARLGGDEFVILLPDTHQDDCTLTAKRIIECLAFPILLSGKDVRVTPSIGIAVYPEDGQEAETLIKHADLAMYQAKRRGKNNYQMYKTGC
ncbi:sensor domain-containing diguanylate cyclase [Pseudobacillus wudalianchiensis]|uniref:Diguanylate cyclase n=1 Tax=Pseudobacillus wudalianchiensis TaxID=1743143 RepID=A0A1B9AMB3_9BACI|nr:sensor domain-containing diguanylate cyclase [Bacillus wudalianchiensis]OCA84975.1 hypothetical protein A8F95_09715 [Bacillus wudalianchiensis]